MPIGTLLRFITRSRDPWQPMSLKKLGPFSFHHDGSFNIGDSPMLGPNVEIEDCTIEVQIGGDVCVLTINKAAGPGNPLVVVNEQGGVLQFLFRNGRWFRAV